MPQIKTAFILPGSVQGIVYNLPHFILIISNSPRKKMEAQLL